MIGASAIEALAYPAKATGGVTIDPLAPNWISVESFPDGKAYFYNTDTNGAPGDPSVVAIYDDTLTCPSTAGP